jgi:hypothetical protein
MYNLTIPIYAAILFFILTPGVLLTLPPNSTKLVVAMVHSLVFFLLFFFTYGLVYQLIDKLFIHHPQHMEGMTKKNEKEGLGMKYNKPR